MPGPHAGIARVTAQKRPPDGLGARPVPKPGERRTFPHLASAGRRQEQLFNGFALGSHPAQAGRPPEAGGGGRRPRPHLAGGPGGRTTARPPSSQTPPLGFPPTSRPAPPGAAAAAAAVPPQPLPRALHRLLRPQPEPPSGGTRRRPSSAAPPDQNCSPPPPRGGPHRTSRTGFPTRLEPPNGRNGRSPGTSAPAGALSRLFTLQPGPTWHFGRTLPGRGRDSNPRRRLGQSRAGRRPSGSNVVQSCLTADSRAARSRGQAANGDSGRNKEGGGKAKGCGRGPRPLIYVGSLMGQRSGRWLWRWLPPRRLWWVSGRPVSRWTGYVGSRGGGTASEQCAIVPWCKRRREECREPEVCCPAGPFWSFDSQICSPRSGEIKGRSGV